MNKYDDIINLPRYEIKHPRMSIESRSAQFAPFSALNGYEEEVKETVRITDSKIELSNEQKENINNKLTMILNNNIKEIVVTYLIHDNKKSGGKYISEKKVVKKLDTIKQEIIFIDKSKISINNIIKIETE